MLEIERSITKTLKDWAKRDQRKVLLLRGARQVGKTFVCRQLGRTFKSFVEVNLVEQPLITRLFEDQALSIDQLISSIAALAGKRIIDGETLLFIDEIQASKEAIERLRFFYERRPNLHVIATGSLLEFALEEVGSFGVGRIENLFMHPLTFEEVLLANGAAQLLELIRSMTLKDPLPKPLHEKALNLLRQYLIVGGLPEAQAQFIATKDLLILDRLSSDLLTTYEDDFAKYHKKVPAIRLRDTLRAVAFQSGKKFIYSHAYRDAVSKEVHSALDLLSRAGLAHKIHHTAASGVPLGAQIDPKTFKVIPHDIGLFNQLAGLKLAELLTAGEIHLINKGALVEVFVGLELLAHGVGENNHRHTRNSLFYWHREAKSSNAELDYVLEIGREIIPLEVKASGTGAMRSMRVFLKEKEIKMGIRVSAEPLAKLEDTLVLPLYALSEVTRLWLSGFAK
jgi:predicted AAA+ superfamily ATPase